MLKTPYQLKVMDHILWEYSRQNDVKRKFRQRVQKYFSFAARYILSVYSEYISHPKRKRPFIPDDC